MTVLQNGVLLKSNRGLKELLADFAKLADVEVLIGFPEDTTARPPNPDEPPGLTNASLAYIHDNGAPEQNIPARPFMIPAVESIQEKVADKMGQIVKAVLAGKGQMVIEQGLHQVGLIGKLAIQTTINDGIDPPLAAATLKARAKKGRKGAQKELNNRAAGLPPSTAFAKPLVDTGELRNAASYAIRSRKKRR